LYTTLNLLEVLAVFLLRVVYDYIILYHVYWSYKTQQRCLTFGGGGRERGRFIWNCPCIHSLSLCRAAQIPVARSHRQILYGGAKFCGSKVWSFLSFVCTSCQSENIQAGLILRDFFLHSFCLMWLENLHYLSNLHDNFRFNTVWHQWSVTTLTFSRRQAWSDFSATPSVVYGLIT
jgi:hypothetical protein